MSADKPILSRRQRASAKLNQRHLIWARLTAIEGLSYGEAYKQAFNTPSLDWETAAKRGQTVADKPEVKRQVRDLLRAAKITDLDSPSTAYQRMLEAREAARADKAWTAVASFDRMLNQAQGNLRDSITLTTAAGTPDIDLIKRLAGDDPVKQQQVAALIGKPDFAKSLN